MGIFLGVPIIRIIVFGVYIGVPLFWETTTYMSYSLNSLTGVYIEDYIGDYYMGY